PAVPIPAVPVPAVPVPAAPVPVFGPPVSLVAHDASSTEPPKAAAVRATGDPPMCSIDRSGANPLKKGRKARRRGAERLDSFHEHRPPDGRPPDHRVQVVQGAAPARRR